MIRSYRSSKQKSNFEILKLEDRQLLAVAVNDLITVPIAADAVSLTPVLVDVLENDPPRSRIVSTTEPTFGSIEIVRGQGPSGRDQIRYFPNNPPRGWDTFTYTIEADGNISEALATVSYSQPSGAFSPWSLEVASPEVSFPTSTRSPLAVDGKPLLSIKNGSEWPVKFGVQIMWPFQNGLFPGTLISSVERTDASFYPIPVYSGAWVFGTVEGVNAILAGLEIEPEPGRRSAEPVNMGVNVSVYSSLMIHVDSSWTNIPVRFLSTDDDKAPSVSDDFARIETSLQPTRINVIANDSSSAGLPTGTGLTLVSAKSNGIISGSTISIDPATGEVLYQPPRGFIGADEVGYVVRNASGLTTYGVLRLLVQPPILAIGASPGLEPLVQVVNADTMEPISEFLAFDASQKEGVNVSVTDIDGNGYLEILTVLGEGGPGRVRAYTIWGGGPIDTSGQDGGLRAASRPSSGSRAMIIPQPAMARNLSNSASRSAISAMAISAPDKTATSFAAGDLNGDFKAEIVQASARANGSEIRISNPISGQLIMSKTIPGVRQASVAINPTSRTVIMSGLDNRSNLKIWNLNIEGRELSSQTVMAAGQLSQLTRRKNSITGSSLSFGDSNGDGLAESVLSLTFRDGSARVMSMTPGARAARQLMSARPGQVTDGLRVALRSGSIPLTPKGGMIMASGSNVSMFAPAGRLGVQKSHNFSRFGKKFSIAVR
jgi:hypothetical protein